MSGFSLPASPPSTGASLGRGSRHGNQDGDAARAGGAVDPDVSQHATVLPDQEEDLHIQVQTHSADISRGS